MSKTADFIRPHIRAMPAYEPILPFEVLSDKLGRPIEQIIKLDANENPYGPVPAVQEALGNLPYPHIYPDPQSRSLRQALAEYHDVDAESILVGAGADELIDLLMRLVLEPGDRILNCPPTFGMYAFDADLNAAEVVTVPRNKDFSLDLVALKTAIEEQQPRILFLANPNNPDGSLVTEETIKELLNYPLLLVVDEAYVEFAKVGTSMLGSVKEYDNLIVLRTFSKWAGLAGLRVGYGVFPNDLIEQLWKLKQPYNVSVAAAKAAEVSLKHAEQLEANGTRIIAERERLMTAFEKIDWLEPYPSQANFILCKVTNGDAKQIKLQLEDKGILIRYFNKPGLQDYIRMSVGKAEHTDALLEALKELERVS